MQRISDRVNSLAVSQTLAMSQKSAELKAAGVDVVNMSVGEPDFNTSRELWHGCEGLWPPRALQVKA